MKNLLALLFLLTTNTYGQSSEGYMLEGFWGLKFGESIAAVKAKADKKVSTPGLVDKESIIYRNVDFGGNRASTLFLYFFQDKLHTGIATFSPETDPGVFGLYQSIKSSISEKWWRPQTDVEKYKYPFEDSKEDLTAIRGGYASIISIWTFPRTSLSPYNGIITLNIDNSLKVVLGYSDGIISKKASDARKSATSKDF